jgi:hypothetical protein
MIEFTAAGAPRLVAETIEQCATASGSVSAIVVPWESDRARLSMSVTAVRSDGWAIEHTNLGTITLTDLGHDSTRVAIVGHAPDHPEKQKLTALLDRFAQQVRTRLDVAS